MKTINNRALAQSAADQIIAERFGKAYGITTHSEYLDHLDRITTAHLEHIAVARVIRTAGGQRRKSRIVIENGQLLIYLPMNDARSDASVWAVLEYSIWLDLMECGANGAWFYAYKGTNRKAGQVRTKVPFSDSKGTTNATIARMIVNAKTGQQARTQDGNPLNLRRGNLYIVGNPNVPEGRVGHAKTDTRAQIKAAAEVRAALAGKKRNGGSDA